jgi:TolA-binding protein
LYYKSSPQQRDKNITDEGSSPMRKSIIIIASFLLITQASFSQISGLGASVGTNVLFGESKLTDSALSPNIGVHGLYDFSDKISLKLQAGYGQFGIDSKNLKLTTSFIPVEVLGIFSPFGKTSVSPFLHFGLGAISFTNSGSRYYDGLFIGGGGVNAEISDNFSFLVSTDLRYTTSDQFNGITNGLYDGYLNFQLGVTYNINKQKSFERKSNFDQKDIIAANNQSDQILEHVEMQSKINQLKNNIAVKDEQIRQFMSQIQDRQGRINKIETEIANLPQNKTEMAVRTDDQQVTVQNTSKTEQLSNIQIKQKYDQAQSLIQSKQFNRAISELEILSQNSINHPLHSNFLYWIGECYFAQGKYSDAISSFEKVNNFQESHKLDDSLLMSGISSMKLGELQSATQKFKELIQKYPKSEYVGKATKYLQSLERQIIS